MNSPGPVKIAIAASSCRTVIPEGGKKTSAAPTVIGASLAPEDSFFHVESVHVTLTGAEVPTRAKY
jgi:hypothetical protein